MKAEIDQMLDVGIIDPVEASECISPMVVQDKKDKRNLHLCQPKEVE